MVTKGEGRGRINKEFETSRYMLLHINWINTVSAGNYTQCLTVTYNEKESEKEYIWACLHMQNQFDVHIKVTQHNKLTILQFKKRIPSILNMLAHNQKCQQGLRDSPLTSECLCGQFFPGEGGRGRGKKEGRVSGELIR